MELPRFLRRLWAQSKPSPPPATPAPSAGSPAAPALNASANNADPSALDPALAEMFRSPKLLPDPVFPKDDYLRAFAMGFFKHLLRQSKRESAIARIQVTATNRQMTSLLADGFGFWAIDLDVISERGVAGKDAFVDRVREPIRRPPPQLAAVAVEQHILDRGVARIQIDDGPILVGGAQICSLKTVGWYVAALMVPKGR